MGRDVIRVTPDPERARSILKQVELRLEDAAEKDPSRFATLIIEDYYEIIKELMTALLVLEGYKTLSHLALIETVRVRCSGVLSEQEIRAIDELRRIRNRIAYEGFTVTADYYSRKAPLAKELIEDLRKTVSVRLNRMAQRKL